jgi:hypothetical protein
MYSDNKFVSKLVRGHFAKQQKEQKAEQKERRRTEAAVMVKAQSAARKSGQIIDFPEVIGKFCNVCARGYMPAVRSLLPAIIAEQSYKVAVEGVRLACKNRNFEIAKYILTHAIPSPHAMFNIESADINNELVRDMSADVDLFQWLINYFSLTLEHFGIDSASIQNIDKYSGLNRTHDFQRLASDVLLRTTMDEMQVSPRDLEPLRRLADHFVAKSKSDLKAEFEFAANRVITLRASLQNRRHVRLGGESISSIPIEEYIRRRDESERFRTALNQACLFGDEELVFWLMQEVKFFPEMRYCLDGFQTACAEFNFSMVKDIIIYSGFTAEELFRDGDFKWFRNITMDRDVLQWVVDHFDLTPERFAMYNLEMIQGVSFP